MQRKDKLLSLVFALMILITVKQALAVNVKDYDYLHNGTDFEIYANDVECKNSNCYIYPVVCNKHKNVTQEKFQFISKMDVVELKIFAPNKSLSKHSSFEESRSAISLNTSKAQKKGERGLLTASQGCKLIRLRLQPVLFSNTKYDLAVGDDILDPMINSSNYEIDFVADLTNSSEALKNTTHLLDAGGASKTCNNISCGSEVDAACDSQHYLYPDVDSIIKWCQKSINGGYEGVGIYDVTIVNGSISGTCRWNGVGWVNETDMKATPTMWKCVNQSGSGTSSYWFNSTNFTITGEYTHLRYNITGNANITIWSNDTPSATIEYDPEFTQGYQRVNGTTFWYEGNLTGSVTNITFHYVNYTEESEGSGSTGGGGGGGSVDLLEDLDVCSLMQTIRLFLSAPTNERLKDIFTCMSAAFTASVSRDITVQKGFKASVSKEISSETIAQDFKTFLENGDTKYLIKAVQDTFVYFLQAETVVRDGF